MTDDKAIDLNKLRAALSEYFGFQKCVSDSEDDIIAKAAQAYLNRTPAIEKKSPIFQYGECDPCGITIWPYGEGEPLDITVLPEGSIDDLSQPNALKEVETYTSNCTSPIPVTLGSGLAIDDRQQALDWFQSYALFSEMWENFPEFMETIRAALQVQCPPASIPADRQKALRSLDVMKTMLDGYTIGSPRLDTRAKMKGQLAWNTEHYENAKAALTVPSDTTDWKKLERYDFVGGSCTGEYCQASMELTPEGDYVLFSDLFKSIDTKLGE